MPETKKKLKTSIVFSIIAFTVLFAASLGAIGFSIFCKEMVREYRDSASAVLRLVEDGIDWDGVERSVKEKKENEAFLAFENRMDFVKRGTEMAWIYALEPLNENASDNMRYICIGNTPEEYKEGRTSRLGDLTGNEFPADVAKKYLDFFTQSAPGDFWYYPNKTEWGWTYTTSNVIRNSSGKAFGVLSVDIYMEEIENGMFFYIVGIVAASALLALVFIFALTFWLNRRVVNPLTRIQKSAVDFLLKANGEDVDSLDFEDPAINTKDEIQSLSNALVTMASETKRYMKNLLAETKERERISADLNVASQIQDDMLPHIFPGFPEHTDFELYASMDPAKEVGGDFYDFFFIDKDHIGLVIADVSGKGVPASLFMVISKTVIKNLALSGKVKIPSPAEVLAQANDQLCDGNTHGLFVTVWFGILDLNTGIVTAANAGHEFPAVRHGGKPFELFKDKHGFVLAGVEGARYADYQIQLEPGSTLFVYTDGVPEATNAQEKLFDLERLTAALNIDPDAMPKDLLSIVRAEVDKFVGDAPQFDDLTMLCIKYKGRADSQE